MFVTAVTISLLFTLSGTCTTVHSLLCNYLISQSHGSRAMHKIKQIFRLCPKTPCILETTALLGFSHTQQSLHRMVWKKASSSSTADMTGILQKPKQAVFIAVVSRKASAADKLQEQKKNIEAFIWCFSHNSLYTVCKNSRRSAICKLLKPVYLVSSTSMPQSKWLS